MQPSYAPVGPGGIVTTAMGGSNALLNQMYKNQIAQAQARYAPQQQQGIAAQEMGAGQNALAQGRYAFPTAYANMLNAQLQPAATQANINLTGASTAQTSAAATNQQLINEYVPASQQARISATAMNALIPYLHDYKLGLISTAQYQQALNQATSAMTALNPSAPTVPSVITGGALGNTQKAILLPDGNLQAPSGKIYTKDPGSPQGWKPVK